MDPDWTDLAVSLMVVFWMEFLLPGGWRTSFPAAWKKITEEPRKIWYGKG